MTLIEYLENKYSKSTLKSNVYNIKRFTDYYQKDAEMARYRDVLSYIEHLRKDDKLHPKTIGNCLYAVKIYFNYLLEIGKRKDHPCRELNLKDTINRGIQVDNLYSLESLELFLESYKIKDKSYLENRNKIIISLLIYQALTVEEIVRLEVSDIDLKKGEILIKGSSKKGSKSPRSRTLLLEAKQVLLIYKYLKEGRKKLLKNRNEEMEEGFILGQYGQSMKAHSISRIINKNRVKTEQIQPIKIRQSVIADLLKKGNDVRIVQVFAGHKKSSTTLQYKQTELDLLEKSIKLYHPIQ